MASGILERAPYIIHPDEGLTGRLWPTGGILTSGPIRSHHTQPERTWRTSSLTERSILLKITDRNDFSCTSRISAYMSHIRPSCNSSTDSGRGLPMGAREAPFTQP